MLKFSHILLWLIVICSWWVIYSYCHIYNIGYCIFIINLILSPIGIALCSYAMLNKYNFYKVKKYLHVFFLFYGISFLLYDIVLIVEGVISYQDFGLISDVSIIYFARSLRIRYKKLK